MAVPSPPTSPAADDLQAELRRLRERVALLDEIDRHTQEMVTRLADVVRGSAEVRALATIEIATALARTEQLIAGQRDERRQSMADLLGELTGAQQRAGDLTSVAAALQEQLTHLQRRLAALDADPDCPEPAAPAPPPPVPRAVREPAGTQPLVLPVEP